MKWQKVNNHLVKEFILSDFISTIDFVNKIVPLAEKMNHHPDLLIHSYKKVKVSLTTHSEGKITDLDYLLASEIDKISQQPD